MLMVTFKFCLINCPLIPNFYLANLETYPFLRILMGPEALGLRGIKYWMKQNVLRYGF